MSSVSAAEKREYLFSALQLFHDYFYHFFFFFRAKDLLVAKPVKPSETATRKYLKIRTSEV